MITEKTIESIWKAQREIEAGKKLLADIEEIRVANGRSHDKYAPTIKNAFGEREHFQLGVPSGSNGHRLFNVSPVLAESCIRAHIANKERELFEANECARVELFADLQKPNTATVLGDV